MTPQHLVFFDGDCQLCNRSIQFILKRDKLKKFTFAAQQSPTGQKILESHQIDASNLNTVYYLKGDTVYTKSDAALLILKELSTPLKALYPFIFLPKALRNPIYDFIARHRFSLFGKAPSCLLPSPEIKKRFIDL